MQTLYRRSWAFWLSASALVLSVGVAVAADQQPGANPPPAAAPKAGKAAKVDKPPAPNLPPIEMGKPNGPQGDNWDSIKALPNFSGAWNAQKPDGYGDDTRTIPFVPDVAKRQAGLMDLRAKGQEVPSSTSRCFPTGMPMMMTSPHGMLEFLVTPHRLHIMSEDGNARRIYVDGRKIDPDPDLSFSGTSVGWWDNGALYVDTRGIDIRNQLFYGLVGNLNHGQGYHIQEKMRLTGPDTMVITRTVIDPTTFTQPWTVDFTLKRSDKTAMEHLCIQNNRDIDAATGSVGFSLEPPLGVGPPPKN